MPRKRKWQRAPYSDREEGRPYLVRVIDVGPPGDEEIRRQYPSAEEVALEHIEGDHEGMVFKTLVQLPVRPNNRAARFVAACGLTGEEVYPDDAKGQLILVTYGRSAPGRLDVVSFAPVPKEMSNAPAD